VLRYEKGKQVNICTDSKYAFATLHMYGTMYNERGLLTAGGKEIFKKRRNPPTAGSSLGQSQAAVIHFGDHQRGTDYISRGKYLAGQAAKRAAEELSSPGVLAQTTQLLLAPELPPTPN
jgi:hypothetical protein